MKFSIVRFARSLQEALPSGIFFQPHTSKLRVHLIEEVSATVFKNPFVQPFFTLFQGFSR